MVRDPSIVSPYHKSDAMSQMLIVVANSAGTHILFLPRGRHNLRLHNLTAERLLSSLRQS